MMASIRGSRQLLALIAVAWLVFGGCSSVSRRSGQSTEGVVGADTAVVAAQEGPAAAGSTVEPTATRITTPTVPAVPTPVPTVTPTPRPTVTPTPTPLPTTLHVGVDGAGDGLSADRPMGSIADAMQRLRPGMTLEIGPGRYVGDLRVENPPAGTAEEPIRVLTTGRVEIEGLVRFTGLHHWDIRGLNVTWPAWGTDDDHLVKLTGGSDWVFRDAEVWGAQSYAAILVAGPAERYTLTDLYVHDTVPANDVNQDHLIYVNSTSGPGLVTGNLLVGSPNGRAVKIGGPTSASEVRDVTVSFNTMIDNLGPSNVQVSGASRDIMIRNNIMIRPDDGRNAVTLYDFFGSNVVVADNVVWDATGIADEGVVDGGGNVIVDPELDAEARPTNPLARDAGHLAKG